jgi:polysaccharide export outer membrane protein
VKAGGQTLREIEEALQAKLAAGFFRNPHVSVAIEQYRSQQIFVTGEVRTPGTYALTGGMTLIEALARAGSTTPDAGSEALIARLKPGVKTDGPLPLSIEATAVDDRVQIFRVDIKELQSGKLSQNVQLQDNDTVFISRASLVYVTGQVKSPGSFPLQKGMTVLQAVTLAGGIADRGATGRIVARRQRDGRVVEVRVKLDDPVLADDTIVVRERFF